MAHSSRATYDGVLEAKAEVAKTKKMAEHKEAGRSHHMRLASTDLALQNEDS